jgi:hypothetical protein
MFNQRQMLRVNPEPIFVFISGSIFRLLPELKSLLAIIVQQLANKFSPPPINQQMFGESWQPPF